MEAAHFINGAAAFLRMGERHGRQDDSATDQQGKGALRDGKTQKCSKAHRAFLITCENMAVYLYGESQKNHAAL